MGIVITLCIVTGILVLWRLAFRFSKRTLGVSDLLISIALVLAICQAGLTMGEYTKWGYGYHKKDIPPNIRNSNMTNLLSWINQVFFKIETGLTKMSIVVIYVGIFRKSRTLTVRISRVLNYALATVIISYYIAGSLVSTFQCTPVRKAWNKSVHGTCINNDQFRLANGYINIITSGWIIILPFPALLQVKQQPKEVLQLMGLISLGIIHTSCAVWRVALMYHPDPLSATDGQWATTTNNTVAMVEEFIGITAATIIVMRPCFHLLFTATTQRTSGLFSTRKTADSGYGLGSGAHNKNSKGFRQILRTTEIEMESRNRTTEDDIEVMPVEGFGRRVGG